MGFPRQEYWSGLPFPSPGDLPNPEIKAASLALAGRFFTTEPPGKPYRAVLAIVILLYVISLMFICLLTASLYKSTNLFIFFWPHCAAHGILVSWTGIEPLPPALEARILYHWTAREVLEVCTSWPPTICSFFHSPLPLSSRGSLVGKLSSGHRTGKGQFSFQSQRKAMPKNIQTTVQLHSSHTPAK